MNIKLHLSIPWNPLELVQSSSAYTICHFIKKTSCRALGLWCLYHRKPQVFLEERRGYKEKTHLHWYLRHQMESLYPESTTKSHPHLTSHLHTLPRPNMRDSLLLRCSKSQEASLGRCCSRLHSMLASHPSTGRSKARMGAEETNLRCRSSIEPSRATNSLPTTAIQQAMKLLYTPWWQVQSYLTV